jgi:hypothetical protein
MASVSYYQTLQVKQDATQAEIAAAYRRLARRFHPDLNPAPDAHRQMQVINEAYNTLRHPERRRRYDETLAPPVPLHRSQAPRAPRVAARHWQPHPHRRSLVELSETHRQRDRLHHRSRRCDGALLADLQRRIPPAGRRYDITHNRWHVAVEYEDVLRTLFRNYAPVVQAATPAPQPARRTPNATRTAPRPRQHADRKAWGGMVLAVAAAVAVYALIFSRMVLPDASCIRASTGGDGICRAHSARCRYTPPPLTEGALAFPADCASAQAANAPTYFQEACKTLEDQLESGDASGCDTFAMTTTRVASNIRSGPDTRFPVLTTAPPAHAPTTCRLHGQSRLRLVCHKFWRLDSQRSADGGADVFAAGGERVGETRRQGEGEQGKKRPISQSPNLSFSQSPSPNGGASSILRQK